MDLDDYHNNFYAGIHAANMAGTWQAIVNGFAGLRCNEGHLRFKPYLPKSWVKYTFKLRYQDAVLKIEIGQEDATFTLLQGEKLTFVINEKEITLEKIGESHCEKI